MHSLIPQPAAFIQKQTDPSSILSLPQEPVPYLPPFGLCSNQAWGISSAGQPAAAQEQHGSKETAPAQL